VKKLTAVMCVYFFTNILFAQWVQMLPTNGIEFGSIETQGNLIVAGAEGRGVFISIDNGDTWRESSAGLQTAVYIRTIAIVSSGIFIGTDSGIYFSSDTGVTWNARNSGITVANILKIALNGQNIFAVGDGGIYYSSNEGKSWTLSNNGITNITMIDVCFAGSYVYAGGGGAAYISNNMGSSWTQIKTGLPSIASGKYFTLVNNNIYLGTHGCGVYAAPIGGETWMAANSGSISNAFIQKLITVRTNIFASTWGQGMFVTTDLGVSWSLINNGYTNMFSKEIAANTTHIFVVGSTGSTGIWRRPLNDMIVSVDKTKEAIPTEFRLNQNYPNPFNPSTIIKYQIPKEAYIKLNVYDNLGREVENLVVGTVSAGVHETTWTPGKISSGIYFITLNTGNSLFIKKAVLLK
jgi:photosystem II stability/assembly factor-like uncharacterized protein